MLFRSRATDSRLTAAIRPVPPLLALAGSAALLVACGSSSGSSGASSGAPSAAAAPQPANSSVSGTTVTATETEFKIALSQTSLKPGSYTFQARNAGRFPHALSITGPGVSKQSTNTLQPGQTGNVTVALQPGDYTVFCPVDGHRARGMLTHISVSPGAAAPTSGATSSTSTSGGGAY